MNTTNVRFDNKLDALFTQTLNKRIKGYFKENNLAPQANAAMVAKTLAMLAIYFVPYSLVLSGVVVSLPLLFFLYIVMGVGTAGIGFSVMHDAIHGAYSTNRYVNQILGYTLNLMGGNATNWKIQHNVLHHTFTNIAGHDEDVSPKPILRFSPDNKRLPMHKYQHIYAWFLYGMMTISWILMKDIVQMIRYTRSGLLIKQKALWQAWIWVISSKIFYFSYALILPILMTPFLWWQVLLAFLLMHYVAGFLLGIVFQPAHVLADNTFVQPNEKGQVAQNFTVHQLMTTSNFAPMNRLLSWYVGGLNFQIEHHLFPNICHIHYRHLSPIVQQTAEEFGVPYKSIPTFGQALRMHGKMLYLLGNS